MFDHKAVNSTDKHEKAAIAIIAPVASLIVMVGVVRVMIPSDIATTAKWFGDTFTSTVSPGAIPSHIVSVFGNPQYPLEGNVFGLLLTFGVLVMMVAMARAGQWFPGKDMIWISAMWGLIKHDYRASDLNSQKLSLFLTTVLIMGVDLYTDVLGKTIVPVGLNSFDTALLYIGSAVKLFVITNVMSEMFLFASAGVFFTSFLNLFDGHRVPKFTRPAKSGKAPQSAPSNRQSPVQRGQEPGRRGPTKVPSYAQARTQPATPSIQRNQSPPVDRVQRNLDMSTGYPEQSSSQFDFGDLLQ